jgi:hypothetical protein
VQIVSRDIRSTARSFKCYFTVMRYYEPKCIPRESYSREQEQCIQARGVVIAQPFGRFPIKTTSPSCTVTVLVQGNVFDSSSMSGEFSPYVTYTQFLENPAEMMQTRG